MKGRYECWLDGQGLTAMDESIILLDVRESEPVYACTAEPMASREGQRLLHRARRSLDIRILFEVHEYDTQRRSRIIDQVCAWASGRVLTVSYRAGQRLNVVCTGMPSVGSALRWTDPLALTFTAYALPFWESISPVTAAMALGSSGTLHLRPFGTADACCLTGSITAGTSAVNTLRLTVNGRFFEMSNLGLSSGETFSIGYDEHQLLTLRKGDISVLNCRTPASADDLILRQRQDNAVLLEADAPVTARLCGRGLYL